MSADEQDRGLKAVRRVRDVREQDSRIGLRAAIEAVRRRDADLVAARARVESAGTFGTGSAADFRGHVDRLAGLVRLQDVVSARATASREVAEEATRRWQHDHQRVRVVDLLLERRAAERAAERARVEAHQMDDLATQAWQRNQSARSTDQMHGKEQS